MNNKTWIYLLMIAEFFLMLTNGCIKDDEINPSQGGTVTDIDGNVYRTVTIGTQVWMAENLKTTKYRNGDLIPNVTDDADWIGLYTGAYCWFNNDATYKARYGALYNWRSLSDSRYLAPKGWHIPSDEEWKTLTTYLGGEETAGGKLKEMGTVHWLSPNHAATNESGFTALPGGCRFYGTFSGVKERTYWWSSTKYSATVAWYIGVYSFDCVTSVDYATDLFGFSVRCIKD